jgi:hypothetical protein
MNSKLEDFVKSLKLPIEGRYSGNEYIITMDNSDDFSDIFNYISLNKTLSNEENMVATGDSCISVFTNGWFEIKLVANFNSDIYRVTIGER